jgi:formylglycine-generating enzyme required for sulfatase activity
MRGIALPSLIASAQQIAALIVCVAVAPAAWSEPRYFRDCADCPEMVAIPAGRFLMGSPPDEPGRRENEGPQRDVSVRAFAIGRYEVTVAEFTQFTHETGHGWPGDCFRTYMQDATHPAACVSWNDAKAFVAWLAARTGQPYRLPSEAEWEYAARAGTTTAFHVGPTITAEQANFDGKGPYSGPRIGTFRQSTTPVGSFPPNVFGLHDMHGNVWE